MPPRSFLQLLPEFDLDGDGDTTEPLPVDTLGNASVTGAAPDLGADEAPDPFQVSTLLDTVDATDELISLREAFDSASMTLGTQTIKFADGLTSLLRLTQGEIRITDALAIDGAGRITITGDANGDGITEAGTDITDVSSSLGWARSAGRQLPPILRIGIHGRNYVSRHHTYRWAHHPG